MQKSNIIILLIFFAVTVISCSRPESENRNATAPIGSPMTSPAATSATETGFVYTADERGNSISVIDLAAGQVKTIPIPISPHNVQVSRDGRMLLAVGMVGGMSENQTETGKGGEMRREKQKSALKKLSANKRNTIIKN